MIAFKVTTDYGTIQSTSLSTILDVFMLMDGKELSIVEDAERPLLLNNSKEDNN